MWEGVRRGRVWGGQAAWQGKQPLGVRCLKSFVKAGLAGASCSPACSAAGSTCMIGIATVMPRSECVTAAMQHMLPRFQMAPASIPGPAARLLVACKGPGGAGKSESASNQTRISAWARYRAAWVVLGASAVSILLSPPSSCLYRKEERGAFHPQAPPTPPR
jgi:hypothetical protein